MANPDWTVTNIALPEDYREGLIDISWTTVSAGYGHLSFRNDKGQIRCSSEGTNREFVKSVLDKLVDIAIFDD